MRNVLSLQRFATALVVAMSFFFVQSLQAQDILRGELQKVAEIPGTGMIDGPAYNTDDGMLYFVEMEAGWVSRITTDGRNYERFYDLGKMGGKVGAKGWGK